MVRKMSAQAARDNFGELISSVHFTKEPVIVEKKGKPYAALISADQLEAFLEFTAANAWSEIDRMRAANADVDPIEALALVTDEVDAVRHARKTSLKRAS